MGSDWRTVLLGDLAEIFDGPHATPPKTAEGPVFLGISNLGGGRLTLSGLDHLSESDYLRWTKRVEPRAGDVVFSYETRLGEAALIPAGLRCCLGRRMGLLRPRPGLVDQRFLLYAYLGPEFQGTLRERTIHGSTVDRIPLTALPSFPITVPQDILEQRAIAHILGTLDDKIELNRRMNETLEAIARALFKSWFVDFDPVRAKMEGRWRRGESLPGLPAHLYELFPDRLVDSELGEIPEGWGATTLEAYATLNLEVWSKKSQPPIIRYVDLSNTKWGRIETMATYPASEAPSRAKRILNPGDTIIGTVRPGNGSYALVWEDGLTGSTGFAALRPLREDCVAFVYLAATAGGNIDSLAHLADGGAYPAVKQDVVISQPIAGPPEHILEWFSRIASPFLQQYSARESESDTLAALRDTLLPKLISGEIRVSERIGSDVGASGEFEESA